MISDLMLESLLFPKLNKQELLWPVTSILMSFWIGDECVLLFKMSVTKNDEKCLMVANTVFEHD